MSKRSIGALIGIALIAGIVGSGLTAWVMQPGAVEAQPTTLTAREFRIVDPTGRTRATLSAVNNFQVALALSDAQGITRVHLATAELDGEETTWLAFNDAGGEPRLSINMFRDRPGIFISDGSGNLLWSAP